MPKLCIFHKPLSSNFNSHYYSILFINFAGILNFILIKMKFEENSGCDRPQCTWSAGLGICFHDWIIWWKVIKYKGEWELDDSTGFNISSKKIYYLHICSLAGHYKYKNYETDAYSFNILCQIYCFIVPLF